jgi:hypothetical protein
MFLLHPAGEFVLLPLSLVLKRVHMPPRIWPAASSIVLILWLAFFLELYHGWLIDFVSEDDWGFCISWYSYL